MGAKLGGGGGGPNADMNLTPLIDIVLVVLIIMMVNIPIQIEEMTVKLPSSKTPPSDAPPPTDQLVVAIYDNGEMALNRRLMPEEVLFYEVTRRLRPMADKNVFIDAGPTVPYGAVVHAVDIAREAGAEKVGLAKLKETGPLEATSVAPGAMPRGVIPGSPKVVGSLSEVKADEALQQLLPSLKSCYEQRLAVNPELSGRLTLRYGVGPDGEHLEPPTILAGSTIEDPELVACVEQFMPAIQFPRLGEGLTAAVQFPILFSPG